MSLSILWTSRSRNAKTGDVPTAWVGTTRDEAEESCTGCPLLHKGCYAWSGPVQLAAHTARKTAARQPLRYRLGAALSQRSPSARMVRLSGLGDVGRCGVPQAQEIKDTIAKEGLQIVGYTHHWRESEVAAAWRTTLMASTESLAEADEAMAQGWRATVIVDASAPRTMKTPAGATVVVCPAQVKEKALTCNDCRLCSGERSGPIVAFRAHGNQAAQATQEAPLPMIEAA